MDQEGVLAIRRLQARSSPGEGPVDVALARSCPWTSCRCCHPRPSSRPSWQTPRGCPGTARSGRQADGQPCCPSWPHRWCPRVRAGVHHVRPEWGSAGKRLCRARRAVDPRVAIRRHRKARLIRGRQRIHRERNMVRVAAMLQRLRRRAEVPGIDQLEVRRVRPVCSDSLNSLVPASPLQINDFGVTSEYLTSR